MKSLLKKPIFLLIAVNILIGSFIFRDYGLTWDEPYFYSYADALGYAYDPANWFSGHFDLNNAYGISGDDHKTRGPAYLFLARNFVYGLEALGSDSASAWHLVNFLFFQLGIYFLYRLSMRWIKPSAAFASALLFSTQPLLWGHAFINPKDPPFLTFFLASVCLGFEMVDQLADDSKTQKQKFLSILLPAILLGLATSIRVLGPLAGLLVFIFLIVNIRRKANPLSLLLFFAAYVLIAILAMLAAWPYLWENPIANFINVFRFMSDNPTNLAILFHGQVYRAGNLPLRYFPFMLITTLTEPVWICFAAGLMIACWKTWKGQISNQTSQSGYTASLALILSWFLILIGYVLIRRPAMYDGFRHFLFILPPVFVFIGFALEFLLERISRVTFQSDLQSRFPTETSVQVASHSPVQVPGSPSVQTSNQSPVQIPGSPSVHASSQSPVQVPGRPAVHASNQSSVQIPGEGSVQGRGSVKVPIWLRAGLLLALISPGLIGAIRLHPYEYTYYNSFIGGTDGAFRNYETDYWLTCYKDAVEQLNERTTTSATLFVKREAYVAAPYANENTQVRDLRGESSQVKSGDYILINTRTNEDKSIFKDAPVAIEVKRGGATFCIVRQIP